MSMFCYQCEQTAHNTGCTESGICGKDPETAALQDLLVHVTKGIAMYAHRARALGAVDAAVDRFVLEALFTTVTNVNFDPQRVAAEIRDAVIQRDSARGMYEEACRKAGQTPEALEGPAVWALPSDHGALVGEGQNVSISKRFQVLVRM